MVNKEEAVPQALLKQKIEHFIEYGGVIQIQSLPGFSAIQVVLTWIAALLPCPSSPKGQPRPFLLWISDQTSFYPSAWNPAYAFPFQQTLFLYPTTPKQAWNSAIEAASSALFFSLFLRPSVWPALPLAYLRQLQLSAKKHNTRVVLFCNTPLPHWFFSMVLPLPYAAHLILATPNT